MDYEEKWDLVGNIYSFKLKDVHSDIKGDENAFEDGIVANFYNNMVAIIFQCHFNTRSRYGYFYMELSKFEEYLAEGAKDRMNEQKMMDYPFLLKVVLKSTGRAVFVPSRTEFDVGVELLVSLNDVDHELGTIEKIMIPTDTISARGCSHNKVLAVVYDYAQMLQKQLVKVDKEIDRIGKTVKEKYWMCSFLREETPEMQKLRTELKYYLKLRKEILLEKQNKNYVEVKPIKN